MKRRTPDMSHDPATPASQGAPTTSLAPGNLFGPLEARLSPAAKHAYETFQYAFWLPNQEMTMGELRNTLRQLYGEAVDRELEQHFRDRREAVLPCPTTPA